jgi:hypothetical protein
MTGILLAALGITTGVLAAPAQPAATSEGAIDQRGARSFVAELQRGLARDDRQAIAAMVAYPIVVLAGSVRIPIRDATFLLESYDVIFSPELKDIVAQAQIADRGRAAPRHPIVLTPGGMSIGDDLIGVQSIGGSLKITRINIPLSSGVAPFEGSAASRAEPSKPREARRIVLLSGQRSTQVSGALPPGGRESYIFRATKGQWIEVRVDRVPGRAVIARIFDEKRRAPLDARARDGGRIWTGQMPASADYRIEVQRVIPTGTPVLPYDLIVTVR